jgi:hypothetical protein
MVAVGIRTSKPRSLVRLNLTSEHALGCCLSLARDKADLTGGEVGCHGEDCHLSGVCCLGLVYRQGGQQRPP